MPSRAAPSVDCEEIDSYKTGDQVYFYRTGWFSLPIEEGIKRNLSFVADQKILSLCFNKSGDTE